MTTLTVATEHMTSAQNTSRLLLHLSKLHLKSAAEQASSSVKWVLHVGVFGCPVVEVQKSLIWIMVVLIEAAESVMSQDFHLLIHDCQERVASAMRCSN